MTTRLKNTVLILALITFVATWMVGFLLRVEPALVDNAPPVAYTTAEPANTASSAVAPIANNETAGRTYTVAENSVDVVVAGRVIFAMESAKIAEDVLQDYYYIVINDLQSNERLLNAHSVSAISLTPANGKSSLLSAEEALQKLQADPSLLPISLTINRVEIITEDVALEMASAPELPRGAREVQALGTGQRELVFAEYTYRAGVEVAVRESNRFTIAEAEDRKIRIGSFVGSAEMMSHLEQGVYGKSAGDLHFRYPIKDGTVRSRFGWNNGVMNNGIDIYAGVGTVIVAPEEGTIVWCGQRSDYGFVIDIQHGDSGFISRLTHCSNVKVELYQRVQRGEEIAALGSAGAEGESFVHYELLVDGIPYNPIFYL